MTVLERVRYPQPQTDRKWDDDAPDQGEPWLGVRLNASGKIRSINIGVCWEFTGDSEKPMAAANIEFHTVDPSDRLRKALREANATLAEAERREVSLGKNITELVPLDLAFEELIGDWIDLLNKSTHLLSHAGLKAV